MFYRPGHTRARRWFPGAATVTGPLLATATALAAVSTGCDDAGTAPGLADATAGAADAGDEAGELLSPPPFARTQTESELAPQRQACAFGPGAWPGETIGTEYPVGSDIPIDHIIVIMQENRSFDHYLGRLVAQGYYAPGDFTTGGDAGAGDAGPGDVGAGPTGDAATGSGFAHSDQLDGPPAGWSNRDADGGLVVPHPDDEHCFGADHSWGAEHDDYDDGKLDHFVLQNEPDGERTFFYEDDTVIPFYYGLASTFAVGDRTFCSVLSSTWPNRFFLMAGTSFGIGDNSFATLDTPDHPAAQIFSLLEEGGHTWKDYTDGPHMVQFFPYFGWTKDALSKFDDVQCGLMADIANDTLPDVAFVMGDEVDEDSDEGPSDLPGIGGQLVEQIVRNLWASPAWKHTAVFITYDENGGMADHVAPAPACAPDAYSPHDENGDPLTPGAFDQTGFRVPFLVVSPYARAHFVSHVVHDHTSILRFIEARFGLPALTARDANAAPPLEMFDFQDPPFLTPPTITAHTPVDPAVLASCGQKLAPLSCTH
ncbi:MAG TPA: alkaline phosphatase family protein [Polyangiaceae bacterium]